MPDPAPPWLAPHLAHWDGVVSVCRDADIPKVQFTPAALIANLTALREEPALRFDMLVDLAGVDFAEYGRDEWDTHSASAHGFSRAVEGHSAARSSFDHPAERPSGEGRFAVTYHLLSLTHNRRLRVCVRCDEAEPPVLPSATCVWPCADWYEREAFDLFGIVFDGHPDLRRILTDYGFLGHPLRRDFPLTGHVEVRYDPERKRVVYQPVTIEPRVTVPKVRRTADEA